MAVVDVEGYERLYIVVAISKDAAGASQALLRDDHTPCRYLEVHADERSLMCKRMVYVPFNSRGYRHYRPNT